MGSRRQSRSATSVVLVTVLFFVSFGASAGATVLVSSGSDGEPAVAASASPSPSSTPSPDSTPTPEPTSAPAPQPEPSPTVATKRQVKSATSTLCDEAAADLPVLSAARADPKWARIWEVHLSKQGVAPGPIDGEFDPKTVVATKQLQRSLGVADTGKVGEATWSALWTDQCYVAPAPEPSFTWQPSSSGAGSSSGGGGGGTLDRVE